ncbi:alpha/beta hydrolase family protein [Actinomadura rubrisoli]|uniref:Hydrolase n=1 Tax=Actinomadura rubrisoli TaxID=2530368 RepID=A0A4R5BUB3_9ACTN|nr:hydrolase [Actinomadura rubrisoli]TDD89266.1 hydrolase [Actinomadura rubrisoli]
MTAISRRTVLAAAGTAGLVLATAGIATATHNGGTQHTAAQQAAAQKGRVQLRLPAPTGPARVGTTSLHLVDHARKDPWTSAKRELMVSLWYPARDVQDHKRAPWLPPASTALDKQQTSRNLQTSLDNVDYPVTHGHQDAPVRGRRHPVVLFSPGYGAIRAHGTALVQDLASRGYVVVTIDHTHDAQFVEFPKGRLELTRKPSNPTEEEAERETAKALRARQDDTKFVLDQLPTLNTGGNPDAEHRRLPGGLRGSLDLSKIGMFGHSLGGDTTAETMAEDPRIAAGVNMDGTFFGPVAATGLDRPFMLMGNATHGRDNDSTWEDFWSNLRGWRRQLLLRESGHQTFTDQSPLGQQLIKALPIPPAVVAKLRESIGTINAGRAVAAERAYLTAFFDLHLRHRDDHLLSKPSPKYPEIEFIP